MCRKKKPPCFIFSFWKIYWFQLQFTSVLKNRRIWLLKQHQGYHKLQKIEREFWLITQDYLPCLRSPVVYQWSGPRGTHHWRQWKNSPRSRFQLQQIVMPEGSLWLSVKFINGMQIFCVREYNRRKMCQY